MILIFLTSKPEELFSGLFYFTKEDKTMNSLIEAAKSSLSFIAVCLLIFLAILAVAKFFENMLVKESKKASGVRYISYIAMFGALGGVMMLFEIPVGFAPSFYKFDFSELPVLMSGFYLGPVAGVTTAFLKVFIKLLLKSTSTAFVGELANFTCCCAFVLPASIIYHVKKSKKSSIAGMVVGTLVLTIFGSAFNALYLIPKFAELFHMPVEVIVGMGTKINANITSIWTLVLFAVVPLNLMKGTVDSIITFVLYKRLEKVFFKKN